MKKMYFLLMAIGLILSAGCDSSKQERPNIPGMMYVDLTSHGFPITINVPDSTKGKFEITTQSWGATEIKVGKEFQISISEGAGDMALAKSDVAGNDVNKFKRYIVDEPTTIFYESEITQPEFHFYSIVKAGNTSYIVEDIKGEMYSEKKVQKMVDAAKTITFKENKAS